jgi:hypothetical protein
MLVPDGLVNDLEAESHVGSGIPIGYRKYVYPVNVFPALEQVSYTGGQSPHHPGCIDISNGLCQNLKPGN